MERLFGYIDQTKDLVLAGSISSGKEALDTAEIHVYVDSDLAGSEDCVQSTSGCFVTLKTKAGDVPLDFFSCKQSSTSHSSCEAETVAMSRALREKALPIQTFWEKVLGRVVVVRVWEDNDACLRNVKAGWSTAMRHMAKHHKTSLAICHEMSSIPGIDVGRVDTKEQRADPMTKGLDPAAHRHGLELLGLVPNTDNK